MKLKITALILTLLSFISTEAQKPVIVVEDSIKMGNSRLPGITATIPEVQYEKTLAAWTKALESGTKSKVVSENGEMTIFGAILKEVTDYPQVNVYSKLTARDSSLFLSAAFELKKDQYIESSTGEADLSRAKTFMFNFAKKQYIELAEEQLKAEEKKLKDLEKELGSLEKDGTGMEKNIRSNEKSISSEKDKLVALNNDLISQSAAIEQHRGDLSRMSSGPEKDEKVAYIKDLDKQKKQTMKSITKSENRISKYQKGIDKAKSSLPKNDRFQGKLQEQINQQEGAVQRYSDKLNMIKEFR